MTQSNVQMNYFVSKRYPKQINLPQFSFEHHKFSAIEIIGALYLTVFVQKASLIKLQYHSLYLFKIFAKFSLKTLELRGKIGRTYTKLNRHFLSSVKLYRWTFIGIISQTEQVLNINKSKCGKSTILSQTRNAMTFSSFLYLLQSNNFQTRKLNIFIPIT